MKKLFGTLGCILISTLLLVLPASGAIAAARRYQNSRATLDIAIDTVSFEVYNNRQSTTAAQTVAAKRRNARRNDADAAALGGLESDSARGGQ